MEKMSSTELYQKKRQPLNAEEKKEISKGIAELQEEDAKRSGEMVSDEFASSWQKKINEELLKDDHEIYIEASNSNLGKLK